MRKTGRREIEVFSMSFLDVISCGFGAVILLLVIALALEPTTVEKITQDLRGTISKRNDAREKHNNQSQKLASALAAKERSLSATIEQEKAQEKALGREQARAAAAVSSLSEKTQAAQRMKATLQRMSDEMKRLQSQPNYKPPASNSVIGGIPVDSEYIIFIIDTSGSMKKGTWPLVVKKVEEVLSVYPRVKGIQVMNDMGQYMFQTYASRWIPDSPARRKAIVKRIRPWNSFSNSSPVEGIVTAIRSFYRRDRRISLYVFGDDFTGKNINDVIEEVARINARDDAGKARVRIHAFGFPVLFLSAKHGPNRARFAHLMRVLAERNGGSFVGLNALR